MEPEDREELLLLWQTTMADIDFAKQLQRSLTYYSLAGLGGLLAIFNSLEDPPISSFWIFAWLSIGISVLAGVFLRESEISLERYRRRKKVCIAKFGLAFKLALGDTEDYWLLNGFRLFIIIIVAAVLVVWIMYGISSR